MIKNKIALISVSDKTEITTCARELGELGFTILSTGGTANLLRQHGVQVTDVSDYTGFPELMDGRLKTLHPKIHGGILGRRGLDDAAMQTHEIEAIDVVIVNLYPFEQVIKQSQTTLEDAIEHIDIGGPTMVRAAAKNHADVTIVVDPQDYPSVLSELKQTGETSAETRYQLAVKAFAHTARYDALIADYLARQALQTSKPSIFPDRLVLQAHKQDDLRYGENPHQQAAFYHLSTPSTHAVARATLLQGKALSFNNLMDAEAAFECVKTLAPHKGCVIVKHANPCGVAEAETQSQAYQLAYACDPTSAFGGIIAFNNVLEADTVAAILQQQFIEVLIAIDYSAEAKRLLAEKPNVRVLAAHGCDPTPPGWSLHSMHGGLLVQERDSLSIEQKACRVVSARQPTHEEWRDLMFAWKVAKFVKSNAIVYAKHQQTLGIGAGQMSRIDSATIAALKAEKQSLSLQGAVMASDAFFPFRDSIDTAASRGISAVIHPGGSVRDEEVIAAANEHGMAMVLTGVRHFRH